MSEEQTPPFMDQSEWNDCGMSDSDTSGTQDNMFPQNPFVYNGERPAILVKRKNVILFGETGVGKSSIINLMAGTEVALTSSNIEGCTLEAKEYSFTLTGETLLCVYDTVGLNEPDMSVNTFLGAIQKAYQLIRSLHDAGGIDLLLFCIRGGRITSTMQRNYCLFFEFLCGKKVPLAFVVTNLEYEDVMEDWWERNQETFDKYGIQSVAHACITAIAARVTGLAAKRAESCNALHSMLHNVLSNPKSNAYIKDVRNWFVSFVDMLWSSLMKRLPASFRMRDLLKRLEARCGLSHDEAQQLAQMLARDGFL